MTEKQGRLAVYWDRQQERFDELERRRARMLPMWRTRRRRRTLSVLVIVGDVAMIVGAALFQGKSQQVYFTLTFSGVILAGGGQYLLRILTGKMSGGFSLRLDEREREWRHRITYISYQILVVMMMFSVFYSLFISDTEDGGARGAMMGLALVVTGTTLSATMLGWVLPDDDPEDFDEKVEPA